MTRNERTDGPEIESGRISSININSQYLTGSESKSEPPATTSYLKDKQLTQITLSGDGNKLFYADPSDSSKLYVLNLLTGEINKIFDNTFSSIKVTYDGSKAAIYRSDNSLYYYSESTGTSTIASSSVMYYDIQNNGTVYYGNYVLASSVYTSYLYQYIYSSSSLIKTISYVQIVGIDAPEIEGKLYYSTSSSISELDLTPSGWNVYLLTNSIGNGITTIDDGSIIYAKQESAAKAVFTTLSCGESTGKIFSMMMKIISISWKPLIR